MPSVCLCRSVYAGVPKPACVCRSFRCPSAYACQPDCAKASWCSPLRCQLYRHEVGEPRVRRPVRYASPPVRLLFFLPGFCISLWRTDTIAFDMITGAGPDLVMQSLFMEKTMLAISVEPCRQTSCVVAQLGLSHTLMTGIQCESGLKHMRERDEAYLIHA